MRSETALPAAVELERAGVRFESGQGVQRLRTNEVSGRRDAFVVRSGVVRSTTDPARPVQVLTYQTANGDVLVAPSDRRDPDIVQLEAEIATPLRSESATLLQPAQPQVSRPAETGAAPVDDAQLQSGPTSTEVLQAEFAARAAGAAVQTQNTTTTVAGASSYFNTEAYAYEEDALTGGYTAAQPPTGEAYLSSLEYAAFEDAYG